MKKRLHSFAVLITLLTIFCSVSANATTYTASGIGKWTEATTWQNGIVPGTTITVDTIVIGVGACVILDVDVQFNGTNAVLKFLDGGLLLKDEQDGSGDIFETKLSMNAGKMIGAAGNESALLELYEVEIGGTAVIEMGQFGTISARYLTLSLASDLPVYCDLEAIDSVFLTSNQIILHQGAGLYVSGACIVMEGGSVALAGGMVRAFSPYTVWYKGINSLSAGKEITNNGMASIIVDLSNDSQVLTLTENTEIDSITQIAGAIDLGGNVLTTKGDYVNTSTRAFRGSASSGLMISAELGWSSDLVFEDGTEDLLLLGMNLTDGALNLASDLNIHDQLKLESGILMLDQSTLTMEENSTIIMIAALLSEGFGDFNLTNTYDVIYEGPSIPSDLELLGTGLNNVTIALENVTDQVILMNDLTIPGHLLLDNGVLNLGGKTLTLNGTFAAEEAGLFHANMSAILNMNLVGESESTVGFTTGGSVMDVLNVNLEDGGVVKIGTNLAANEINLVHGSVLITNNIVSILQSPDITGADANNYVMIDGNGKLKMTLPNDPDSYVTFPVGTPDNYTPALIQNNGASNTWLVNVVPGVYEFGTSGGNLAASKSVVNNSWNISSTNLTQEIDLKLQWSPAMEVNGFDRTDARMSRFAFDNWDHPTPTVATAVGGMYELYRPSVTSLGTFAIVDGESTLELPENASLIANIYPNPATNELNISTEGKASVSLTDLSGKVISTIKTDEAGILHMDIASLPAGIYYVTVNSNGLVATEKLVKK